MFELKSPNNNKRIESRDQDHSIQSNRINRVGSLCTVVKLCLSFTVETALINAKCDLCAS